MTLTTYMHIAQHNLFALSPGYIMQIVCKHNKKNAFKEIRKMRANIVNPTVNKERFHLRLRWHDDSDAIIENSLPPFF